MAKFSMSVIDDDSDSDDEDVLARIKRRRTFYPSQTSSSYNSHLQRHLRRHHQQQQQQHQHKHQHEQSSEDEFDLDNTVGPTKPPGSISVVLSDPDVLDCPICYNPLTVPVFQCCNGHIACSSCCVSLGNKCPSCCGKIGNNRCRAIEKVVESIKVSCCYLKYGCRESINYSKKHEHEEKCIYAPCLCPFPDCLFRGSPRKLSSHMRKEHVNFATRFRYDSVFTISLGTDHKFHVLQEEKDGILFILSQGNSIALKCIDPSHSNGRFAYDLVSREGATSLKFQSFTHCTTGNFNDPPSEDYFLIPDYFYNNDGCLKLEVCIWSKDDYELCSHC